MIDKAIVIALAGRGWSLTKIANKFSASAARIHQIVSEDKRLFPTKAKLQCEICGREMKEKRYIKVEGAKTFLVCGNCEQSFKQELEE